MYTCVNMYIYNIKEFLMFWQKIVKGHGKILFPPIDY